MTKKSGEIVVNHYVNSVNGKDRFGVELIIEGDPSAAVPVAGDA